MDQHQIVHHVGVGVLLGGRAVGGPSCVSDPDGAGDRGVFEACFELVEFAFGTSTLEAFAVKDGDACAIISAVFLATQTVEENSAALTVTDIGYDATHGSSRDRESLNESSIPSTR